MNQIMLKKAYEVDSYRKHTIDIITKSDILHIRITLKKEFLTLAWNEDVKFECGWHIVKNLNLRAGKNEIKDRNSEKSLFFQKSNFKSLSFCNIEISSLYYCLSQILFNQVQAELPKLIKDIQCGIATTQAELKKLGLSCVTAEKQKAFLIKVNQKYQILCKNAINNQYSNTFFKNHLSAEKHLCTVIANFYNDFEINLQENEAQWIISESKNDKPVRKTSNSKYHT